MQCIIDTKFIFLLEGFRECQEKSIPISLLQKLLEVNWIYDDKHFKKRTSSLQYWHCIETKNAISSGQQSASLFNMACDTIGFTFPFPGIPA